MKERERERGGGGGGEEWEGRRTRKQVPTFSVHVAYSTAGSYTPQEV